LREKSHIESEVSQVLFRQPVPPINIDRVTEALEGVKRNTYGENKMKSGDVIGQLIVAKESLQRGIKEIIVLKQEQ
jgi:hypothetical protein